MAFATAEPGKPHPGPWRAAHGGFAHDITIELRVPARGRPGGFTSKDAMWWIIALLRISSAPYLTAPVTIDMPFAKAAASEREPTISPFEIEQRIFHKPKAAKEELKLGELCWVRDNWIRAAELAHANPKFLTAFQAWDSCRVKARTSSSLLLVWGALEQLFAPSAAELRYRVASNLAAYLDQRGPTRLATYKRILRLYNDRSAAAHTVTDSDIGALTESWVILRNALMKMIIEHHIPSQADFEHLIFADDAAPDPAALSWSGGPDEARSKTHSKRR